MRYLPLILTLFIYNLQAQNTRLGINGMSEWYVNYYSGAENSGTLPSFYTNLTGYQELTLSELPFALNYHFTSVDQSGRMLPNSLSFRFNSEQFRNNMRERFKKHLDKKILQSGLQNAKINSLKSRKTEIDEVLSHPSALQELKMLNESDSLRNYLEENRKSLPVEKINELENQIAMYSNVESKRSIYEKLLNEKKKYDDDLKTFPEITDSFPADYQLPYDPMTLKKQMTKNNLLNRFEKTAMIIDRLQTGRFSASWSDFTLRGSTIDGIDMGIVPGGIAVGFISGILYPVFSFGYLQDSIQQKRSVIGATLGYGSSVSDNFYFSALQFGDMASQKSETNQATGKANYIIDARAKWRILKNKITLRGEFAGSQTTYDTELSEPEVFFRQIEVVPPDPPEKWVSNILSQKHENLIFATGYAVKGEISAEKFLRGFSSKTQIQMISPYFQSFGTAFMINDVFSMEQEVQKSLFHGWLNVIASASANSDNLENLKPYTTRWNRYSTGIQIRMPGYPALTVLYQPIFQYSIKPLTVQSFFVNGNYSLYKKRWKHTYNASGNLFSTSPGTSSVSDALNASFKGYTVSLSSFVESPSKLSASFTASYHTRIAKSSPDIHYLYFQLLPRYTFLKRWINGAGILMRSDAAIGNTVGFIYDSSIDFFKFFSFSLRVQLDRRSDVLLSDNPDTSVGILFLSTRLNAHW